MKRLFAILLALIIAFGIFGICPINAAAEPTISISDAQGYAGEEITLPVRIDLNPGIIAVGLQIEFDASALEFKSGATKDFADTTFGPVTGNKFNITWEDSLNPNNTTDGVIAELTFLIKEKTPAGKYNIAVDYDEENIFNSAFQNVSFALKNGKVTVACLHTNKTTVKENEIGPFCELEGRYKEAVYCSDCGVELSREEKTIPPLGHDWDNGAVTKAPTLSSKGVKTFTCKRDKTHQYTEEIPQLSSTPSKAEADNAPLNEAIKKPAGIKTVCNVKKKQMTISFNAVSGAVNYRIAYRKAGESKWTYNWTKSKTSYILNNLKSNALYEFKLAAYKNSGGVWQHGNWSATSFIYFNNLTQKTPKAGKASVTVSWAKNTSASGFCIFYSAKKSMQEQKKITVSGKNKTSYTIKKLAKGKKYYIRVCAYKTKSKSTYLGELSAVKSVKVK